MKGVQYIILAFQFEMDKYLKICKRNVKKTIRILIKTIKCRSGKKSLSSSLLKAFRNLKFLMIIFEMFGDTSRLYKENIFILKK